ncbi:MAG: PEP-CTERM sorting domain-containing protein [Rhodanobacteraceae bacterium]|nr:MAG: PEP-CTERM sorting domain-containing protein [Rhodanobacteraceae bacterium]
MMKRYLLFAVAALLLGLIVAPNAFAIRVIFDPTTVTGQTLTPGDPVCTSNTPCNIGLPNTMYQATFLSCASGAILPPSVCTTAPVTSSWYGVWFNNVTGYALNTFTFSIPIPAGFGGQSLTCSGSPPGSGITVDCPSTAPAADSDLDLTVHTNPALNGGQAGTLPEDFYLLADIPFTTTGVVASVPEPSELGMFGLGLLALGLGVGWQKRRHAQRGNEAP